jgi:hypothetical protein
MRPEQVIAPLVKVAARVLRDNALLAGHLVPISWATAKSTSSTGEGRAIPIDNYRAVPIDNNRAVPIDVDLVDRALHERLSMAPLEEHARILEEYLSIRSDCVPFPEWFLHAKQLADLAAKTLTLLCDLKPKKRQQEHGKSGPKTRPYIRLLTELLILYPHIPANLAYLKLDDKLKEIGASSTLAHPTIAGKSFESWSAAFADKSVRGLLHSRCSLCRKKAKLK